MNVISRKRLREFASRHPAAAAWLDGWYRTARAAQWGGLDEVRMAYQAADQVDKCLVFNKGNDYRLMVRVRYANQQAGRGGTLFLKHFLTHARYSKGRWKGSCK